MNKKTAFIISLLLFSSTAFTTSLWNYKNPYSSFLEKQDVKANALKVKITSGTKYAVSDYMDLEVQLTNELGEPVSNANCQFNLYYPNKTLFKQMTSTYLAYGVYYNNSIKAPSPTGTYTYSVNCAYNSKNAYTSKCLQITGTTTPFSGAVVAPCDFYLNGSEQDYNTYKEYITTIKNKENNAKETIILKICWKE